MYYRYDHGKSSIWYNPVRILWNHQKVEDRHTYVWEYIYTSVRQTVWGLPNYYILQIIYQLPIKKPRLCHFWPTAPSHWIRHYCLWHKHKHLDEMPPALMSRMFLTIKYADATSKYPCPLPSSDRFCAPLLANDFWTVNLSVIRHFHSGHQLHLGSTSVP